MRPLESASTRNCKALLIGTNPAALAALSPLVESVLAPGLVQHAENYPDRRGAAELLQRTGARLCILYIPDEDEEAFSALESLKAEVPAPVLVAALPGNHPELMLRCVRAGAADFLIPPFSAEQVRAVVENAARCLQPQPGTSGSAEVIAVVPAKGGCGASTVAANLASQCKRTGTARVLLADLDALTGSISFLLKLKSRFSFLDVLQRAAELDLDIWKQMIAESHGVDVLLSPETLVDPTADLTSASSILDYARSLYDVVVVDCGGVEGAWNLSVCTSADTVLLIVSNDLPELHAAQRALLYLEANNIDPDRVRLVLNRCSPTDILTRDRIREVLGIDAFHELPADDLIIQRAQMEGKTVGAATAMGKGLALLADRLLEQNVNSFRSEEKGGFLRRLRSRS